MNSSRPLSTILAVALASAVPLHAQNAPAATADVVVNMRDVDIPDVAQQVSRITGRTIILDPAVQGKINVTSAVPLSPGGVWQLFVTALRGQGFAVVQTGRAWRVVPQATAVREPVRQGSSAQIVTRLIRLRSLDPEEAVRVFRPLIAQFGSIEAVSNPDAIVVTDFADNVARIAALANTLDRGGGGDVSTALIELREGSAVDVATAIQAVFGDKEGVRAVADERSNVVLVRGSAAEVAEARRIAVSLDRPNGEAATVRVIRLRYNDAETVTEVISGLLGEQGAAANPVARTLGSLAQSRLAGSTSAAARAAGSASSTLGGLPSAADAPAVGSGLSVRDSRAGSDTPAPGFATEDFAIQAAPDLNVIVLRGAPSKIAPIEALIYELDVRRPQVMIEAAIVEVTGDQSEQLGIQLGLGAAADYPMNTGGSSFSNLGLSLRQVLGFFGVPAAGLIASDGVSGAIGSRGDFGLLVQALGTSSKANLLSTPSITTLDNEAAEIVVGQNVPFRTGSYLTEGVTTTPFTTIERADVGITLRVVPRIHEEDTIRLEVDQEVSSLVTGVTGAADLITNRRSIQTTVLADDGETIVLGGLISDDQIQSKSQVPVLGDIPIVGELFKSRVNRKTRRTLFVFLKPTILRDGESVAAAAARQYGRVRGAELGLDENRSLLLDPPNARLPAEIDGIY
ncbi:type II secretion system secretin GspD [Tsuneonella sp. HG222]